MAEKIKQGDHVEVVYIGRDKNSGKIFDLNDEETAKKEDIYNPKYNYESTVICVGKRDVVEGFDEALIGKDVGSKFTISIKPEKAFGNKNPKLFRLVPASKFKERPFPGMPVEINGRQAMVKTVSGGRIMLDFNHPLAGKEIEYEINVKRKVTDDKEKLDSFMKMYLNSSPKTEIQEDKAIIHYDIPEKFRGDIEKIIKERIPKIKKIEFKTSEAPKNSSKKE
ncbi:MAG: peptidylprolyl isomerase [Nanoarchaeota archaeon]|nr:peptidylprolyl isomerase [Nanoarchaeota archaeon]